MKGKEIGHIIAGIEDVADGLFSEVAYLAFALQ
jgi:hypothetical protein